MFENYFKLAKVFSYCDRFEGRKKIQKIIYVLKEMGYSFEERFSFHFYGPYSEELSMEVEELSYLGVLKEDIEDNGSWNQYIYSLTNAGEEYARNSKGIPENVGEIIRILNNKTARYLELVATIIYFKNLSEEEIIHKVRTLKEDKNYTSNEIQDAFQFIRGTCGINMN